MAGRVWNDVYEHGLWEQFHRSLSVGTKEELLHFYEPFAKSVAARLYGGRIDDSVSFDDYLQYARVGLIDAVNRFDCDRGVAFTAFASTRIRGAILSGIARESELAAQYTFWRKQWRDRVDSLREALASHAESATLADIAEVAAGLAVGVLLEDLVEIAEPADPNPHNDPYAASEIREMCIRLGQLLERLPDRERFVIRGHYIEQNEFQELARQLSISKSRVSQLHSQALAKLKVWLATMPGIDRKV